MIAAPKGINSNPWLKAMFVAALALLVSACEIEGDSTTDNNVAQDDSAGGDGGAGGSADPMPPAADPNPPATPPANPDPPPADPNPPATPPGADPMPPPVDPDPPMTPPPPTDQALFEQTLYPKLADQANFCAGCHGATQIPTFAVVDTTNAYNALVTQQKVDLNNPDLSRVYLRAAVDRHNCGGDTECDRIAMEFLVAIQDWAAQAAANAPPPDTTPPGSGAGPVMSMAVSFADGIDASIARAEANLIAKFEFKEGAGDTAMDTSGAGAAISLTLEGTEWVEGGGLRNVSGKAQASLDDSRKLFDLIDASRAYSVEAWVIPDDTAQDGPARIVSYSQDTQTRNFTLGQNAIYYQLRNRSTGTGANGTPELEAIDSEVMTTLQHVVATFDEASGRKIYINGALVAAEETADTLEWTDDQILVLGNEVTNDRLWKGVMRMVAIHDQVLTSEQVQQNYDAGSDNFVTLRFDVAAAVGAPAYIEMQAAQLDPYSYVFAKPTLVTDATGVPVKNIRVAVNDSVPVAAQAFRRLDTTVVAAPYELSPWATVVPIALGVDADQFHLEFEAIGSQLGVAEAIAPPLPPQPRPDVSEPTQGVRTFSQIHDTMAVLTGIDKNANGVRQSYTELRDSLPSSADVLAFGAAQQIAIQRMAKSYCGAVVDNNQACTDVFGSCEIAADGKQQVADSLFTRFIGADLANQPAADGVRNEIVSLIDDLNCANGCNGEEGRTVLQAACSAALGSAAVTIN